jgi:ribose-phosphate pyrophosphokinase
MSLKTGSANPALAENVSEKLGAQLAQRILERFPDGELHIELQESVRGHDVYQFSRPARP